MKQFKIIIIFFLFGVFIACHKDKEKQKHKLEGKWKLEKALVDGVDQQSKLDTMYVDYYTFNCPESNWHHVNVTIDTTRAKWVNGNCCAYNFGKADAFGIYDKKVAPFVRKEILMFPPSKIIKCSHGGLVEIMQKENYCRTDLFIPMFIDGGFEEWVIIKWKKNHLWLELEKEEHTYYIQLKRIKE